MENVTDNVIYLNPRRAKKARQRRAEPSEAEKYRRSQMEQYLTNLLEQCQSMADDVKLDLDEIEDDDTYEIVRILRHAKQTSKEHRP